MNCSCKCSSVSLKVSTRTLDHKSFEMWSEVLLVALALQVKIKIKVKVKRVELDVDLDLKID